MKTSIVILLAALTVSVPCSAQSVVDGSDAAIPKPIATKAVDAVSRDLFDPVGSQFRSLSMPADRTICGDFNARNLYGAYVGFRRFAYDLDRHILVLFSGPIDSRSVRLLNENPLDPLFGLVRDGPQFNDNGADSNLVLACGG